MNQKPETIPNRQFFTMISMFLLGGNLIIVSKSPAGRDSWIAFILAGVIIFGFLLLLFRLYALNPGLGLSKIFEKNLGKVCGIIAEVLLILMALVIATFIVAGFVDFTKIASLPNTPRIFVTLAFLIPAYLIVRHGTEVIARWTSIVFPIMLVLGILTLFFSFMQSNFTLLQPILDEGFGAVAEGVLHYIAIPLCSVVVFLMLFHNVKQGGKKLYKTTLAGYFVSIAFILLTILRNTVTLGFPTISHLYFPSYIAVEMVSVGNFLQRLEFFVAMSYLLNDFVCTVIFILFISKGIAYIFHVSDYRKVVWIPIIVLFCICEYFINNFLRSLTVFEILPYVTIPIAIGIPVIVYVVSEIRNIKNKRQIAKKT